ncbi:MAG: hypothetical protein NVS4B11_21890 [Ktedonobacteraceae bacterium]
MGQSLVSLLSDNGTQSRMVKFDTQAMQNVEICGTEYQQGTLAGYEVREYLLEKWNRTCAYCGAKDVPLQIEHILARATGGTNRVSNLCLACEPCNLKKGTQALQDFVSHKPDVLKKILAQSQAPLKDASAVNSTRWALYERLKATGVPVEAGTGGMTKFHRRTQGLEKAHWIDAACVGTSTPDVLRVDRVKPLLITADGHSNRQMCLMDRYGFPRTKPKARQKSYLGFQTGDMVKAVIPRGKYKGPHEGRIAIRFRPSFHFNTFDVAPKYLRSIHRNDGYSYTKGVSHSPLSLKA